jgi:GT2 family glycosyltransferase
LKISVIILNYNVRYFLEQCILSVEEGLKYLDGEIIVIDNNSQDDSCDMVKQRFPHIKLIENKENVGFSKANNQAVAMATGEYLCILNPDTAVTESTLKRCVDYAEAINNIGALGVYLMDGTGNFLPESKRNIPTPKVSFLKLIGDVEKYYATHISKDENGCVDVLVGAFMFMKRSVYNEVGGFDEDYFMYGEDIDLSYKITKAGYQNHYLGSVSALHYKGESTLKDRVYFDRFYNAMLIFYKKHFSQNSLSNFAVHALTSLAKIVKGSSRKVKTIPSAKIQKAYVFTEDLTFYRRLSEKMEIELITGSKLLFDDPALKNCLFIFDTTYMSYSQIFSVMSKFKNRNNQFRIRPPHANFVIGSDKSDEKGSVVVF